MIIFPNAKINVGLYVTEKRNDGYHNLETIFLPIPLYDALELTPAVSALLSIHGSEVPGASTDNLVWRAYKLLQQEYPNRLPSLAIHLLKQIPMGAGLGGGSADGAFMLRLLNTTFELGISDERLEQYALQLGSDCPIFIRNKAAFATGRGELLTDLPLSLQGYSLQLVCPQLHISTAMAFGQMKPRPAPFDLRQLPQLPITEWKHYVQNDFERTIFPHFPELEQIKQALYAQGAVYAAMSGTGSTVYGIFPKGEKAREAIFSKYKTYLLDL